MTRTEAMQELADAAGDDKAQEKAKNQMAWSIMGVVIGLAGLSVVYAVDTLLWGRSGL